MSILTRRLQRHTIRSGTSPTDPLNLSGVAADSQGTTATVSWLTNKPADSHAALYYGPAKHCTFNWQLTGTLDTSADAAVYDVDGFETTAQQVAALHGARRYCMAYCGGGGWEEYQPDVASFPSNVSCNTLSGWPSEKWIDICALDVLEPIMSARADVAKSKGFDAVEWDCVEDYNEAIGFALTQADQHAFNKILARITHARGMACMLKNCPGDATATSSGRRPAAKLSTIQPLAGLWPSLQQTLRQDCFSRLNAIVSGTI